MITTGFILLIISHYLTGRGLLKLFGITLNEAAMTGIALFNGVALASCVPLVLELAHIPISANSVMWGMIILTLIFCVPLLIRIKLPDFKNFSWPLHLYDYPYLFIFGSLLAVSIWHCYYYPVLPRDMLSGPEVMAEYAIKEGSMINSIFKIDLQTTNNHLKPPYITSLQIIYKLFVNAFGQLWLSVTVVGFLIWLYTMLREKIHPVIGGLLLLFFITIPEMYAYTYMILFDYSNAAFFFAAFYFLSRYIRNKNQNEFWFASYLFGIATYIRSETLILVAMVAPLVIFYMYKDKLPIKKIALNVVILALFAVFFYFLCMNVFVKGYLPVTFDVGTQVNKNLFDLSPFFDRLSDMATKLMFNQLGRGLYGYFIDLFLLVLIVDIIFFRKFSKEAIVALYGVMIVYVGLAIIGYLLPLADLSNTTKRGLFKIFPLMLYYMANSAGLMKLSSVITNWEYGTPATEKVATAKPPTKTKKTRKS